MAFLAWDDVQVLEEVEVCSLSVAVLASNGGLAPEQVVAYSFVVAVLPCQDTVDGSLSLGLENYQILHRLHCTKSRLFRPWDLPICTYIVGDHNMSLNQGSLPAQTPSVH